jgi:hypothetical protein
MNELTRDLAMLSGLIELRMRFRAGEGRRGLPSDGRHVRTVETH